MYTSFRRADQVIIRSMLSATWLLVAVGGAAGFLNPPMTVVEELGAVAQISSIIVFFFASVAFVGVAINRYWLEWASSWFAAGGTTAYVASVWFITITNTPTRLQQAAYMTALVFFMVYRGVANSAHARKLRDIHDGVDEMRPNNGD